ncbi:type VI secretion system-associated protein TagF [Sphingomonas sp. OK281]|uniref:type VI secretion system-associated protein TagF n=1 Tax=Sphingomonas sp. OK281 TaxID=1881067 RepID=UPI0008E45AEE|nr:type VI secretion system-associated protein TagF [Sphingomonas sp. OK281]SFO46644.1 type VI secretion system protein ImpM [Sphingomonas sp. OK281]
MSAAPVRTCLFGKLPAHGDFVSRGWNADERDALDTWLSTSLADARSVHGPAFQTRFDSAPPWRCVIDAAEGGISGALAASQDAVGRRFPIFIVVTGAADAAAAEACERLLYDAIGGGWTADALVAQAKMLILSQSPTDRSNRWWTEGGEGFASSERLDAYPAELIPKMLTPAIPAAS